MIFTESPLRDLYRLMVWGPYREALDLLPDAWEMATNRAMGRAAGLALRHSRERIERNLRRAFPHRHDQRELALEAFATHFANQYLPFSFARIHGRNMQRYLRVEGLHHLDDAIATGRGVVVMLPHMGPVQLPLHVLGLMGYPMHQVGGGEVLGLSRTGRWAASKRASLEATMPVRIIDGKGYIRPVLRALSNSAVVMTTCDGTGGGKELGRRVVASVCGHPMKLPVGPFYLALRGDATLLTLHTYRARSRSGPPYVTRIGPPMDLQRNAPLERAMGLGVEQLAVFMTGVLGAHPGDWHFWDHFEPGRFLAGIQ